jgi:hypothetical protein
VSILVVANIDTSGCMIVQHESIAPATGNSHWVYARQLAVQSA